MGEAANLLLACSRALTVWFLLHLLKGDETLEKCEKNLTPLPSLRAQGRSGKQLCPFSFLYGGIIRVQDYPPLAPGGVPGSWTQPALELGQPWGAPHSACLSRARPPKEIRALFKRLRISVRPAAIWRLKPPEEKPLLQPQTAAKGVFIPALAIHCTLCLPMGFAALCQPPAR